jgi:ATP-dependent Clp protease ATP-binding subunit ClpC
MFEFTKKSKKIIELSSQNEGKRLNSDILGPEHIMISLLKDDDSVASRILKNLGVNFEKTITLLERSVKPSAGSAPAAKLPVNQGFKNVVELSREEARNLKNSYIGT